MTAFELVFGLITIITSLALTHLLEGFVNLVRNPARVKFSATHALWAWTGFASAVGNWASFWEMRTLKSWPAWAVLLIVATMLMQYVFCALVTPEVTAEGQIDLVAFHQRDHRLYISAAVALFVLALLLDLAIGGARYYAAWMRDSAFSLVLIAFGLLAIFVRARWAQVAAAVATAGVNTYFMVITCNVAAA
jgi:hypothetical protein